MPKKKPENELTDKEQFDRFKKTARELGVDETGAEMEKAFRRISKTSEEIPSRAKPSSQKNAS